MTHCCIGTWGTWLFKVNDLLLHEDLKIREKIDPPSLWSIEKDLNYNILSTNYISDQCNNRPIFYFDENLQLLIPIPSCLCGNEVPHPLLFSLIGLNFHIWVMVEEPHELFLFLGSMTLFPSFHGTTRMRLVAYGGVMFCGFWVH